jgi:hypothetical protein
VADPLRIKRGTRAQLDAAKTGGTLAAGEPYLVTDDGTAAVGTGTGAYIDLLAVTGFKRAAVVETLPDTPNADTVYITTA